MIQSYGQKNLVEGATQTGTSAEGVERQPSGPRILIVDSNRWMGSARLAVKLSQLGCQVAVACPSQGHPIRAVRKIRRFPLSGSAPFASLLTAFEEFNPDRVVPMCDRGVMQLHRLHARMRGKGTSRVSDCIERSIGSPESFQVVASRYELLKLAREEGVLIPETNSIESVEGLQSWARFAQHPWVLKADGTWGGDGVRVVRSPEDAQRAYDEIGEKKPAVKLIKDLALNRDRGKTLRDWLNSRPSVVAQSWVNGKPGNCAVVCREGQVLAGIAVEVVALTDPLGPASVVEVVSGPEMMLAAERIARRLDLSGFFGLDFMVEKGTGKSYLIEMNPRGTQLSHFSLGEGKDLPEAFVSQIIGQPKAGAQNSISENRIAYFPQPGLSLGAAKEFSARNGSFYDFPHEAPELVDESQRPWEERGLLGQIFDTLRAKPDRWATRTAVSWDENEFRREAQADKAG